MLKLLYFTVMCMFGEFRAFRARSLEQKVTIQARWYWEHRLISWMLICPFCYLRSLFAIITNWSYATLDRLLPTTNYDLLCQLTFWFFFLLLLFCYFTDLLGKTTTVLSFSIGHLYRFGLGARFLVDLWLTDVIIEYCSKYSVIPRWLSF